MLRFILAIFCFNSIIIRSRYIGFLSLSPSPKHSRIETIHPLAFHSFCHAWQASKEVPGRSQLHGMKSGPVLLSRQPIADKQFWKLSGPLPHSGLFLFQLNRHKSVLQPRVCNQLVLLPGRTFRRPRILENFFLLILIKMYYLPFH